MIKKLFLVIYVVESDEFRFIMTPCNSKLKIHKEEWFDFAAETLIFILVILLGDIDQHVSKFG